MSFWSLYFEMFGAVGVSYKYSVPSLVYIGFRMLLRWDICSDSTIKYSDLLKVLPNFCLSFFGDDDCLICYTFCW